MIRQTLNKFPAYCKAISLLLTVFIGSVSSVKSETTVEYIPEAAPYVIVPNYNKEIIKIRTPVLKPIAMNYVETPNVKPAIQHQNENYTFDNNDIKRQHTNLEKIIAREVIATGQMLEGDPRLEEVISVLANRGQALLFPEREITQNWVHSNLNDILPHINNNMASAAIDAATNEISKGATTVGKGLISNIINPSEGISSEKLSNDLTRVYLKSSIEGIKAAAGASNLDILNRLEIDYTLSDSSVEEYSILTMQPLWDSKDLRHNVFSQASYFKKEPDDIFSDPIDYRHTGNVGLAYRYITPNEKHMFGINTFFDHQWPYHHSRMSVGLDYKNTLVGVSANKYIGLTDWRRRGDGFEEIVLDGEDIEFSGRLPQLPELELFTKGYHWNQGVTQVLNPDGSDIYGYQFAAEYTPLNGLTVRASVRDDNVTEDIESELTFRMNYIFGKGFKYLFERPEYNLDSVLDRRYDKVRRNNDIRIQVRQELDITAVVTYAQGVNVSLGQKIAIGTTITTGGSAGDAATVEFGNGARLDVGENTQVRLDADRLVLINGIIQFTSATGGIKIISVPNGTINLIGTDVDVRVSGASNTLRVRHGSANFTDSTGTTLVNTGELAEAISNDGEVPQIRSEGTSIYDTHETEAHIQLNLVGPASNNSRSAPHVTEEVTVNGTLATGNTLSFTASLSRIVLITGSPQLKFTLGGSDRRADYSNGSGTDSLTFTYTITGSDKALSGIEVDSIEMNGGALTSSNGIVILRKVNGSLSGTIEDATAPTISTTTTRTSGGDFTVPTISSITATSSGGNPAGIGDIITVTLDASEDLTQSGTPTLTLDIGGTLRTANFSAINSGNAEFTYTVVSGENDSDGITVTAITVAADELEDPSSNDLNTSFTLPHNLSLDVSTIIMGLTACPSGDLGDDDINDDANHGCARLFGSDPTDMDDVMVFAGNVPGTTTDFFVRRCDLSQDYDPIDDRCEYSNGNPATKNTYQWKNANTISAQAASNFTDGPNNTILLVADASGTHAAAEACAALGSGWYLPALNELDTIYNNLGASGPLRSSFTTSDFWGGFYWSSTQSNATWALMKTFFTGGNNVYAKNTSRKARCARR